MNKTNILIIAILVTIILAIAFFVFGIIADAVTGLFSNFDDDSNHTSVLIALGLFSILTETISVVLHVLSKFKCSHKRIGHGSKWTIVASIFNLIGTVLAFTCFGIWLDDYLQTDSYLSVVGPIFYFISAMVSIVPIVLSFFYYKSMCQPEKVQSASKVQDINEQTEKPYS
eukprot:Awhi_evm1s11947